jgi:hypothetical protein
MDTELQIFMELAQIAWLWPGLFWKNNESILQVNIHSLFFSPLCYIIPFSDWQFIFSHRGFDSTLECHHCCRQDNLLKCSKSRIGTAVCHFYFILSCMLCIDWLIEFLNNQFGPPIYQLNVSFFSRRSLLEFYSYLLAGMELQEMWMCKGKKWKS